MQLTPAEVERFYAIWKPLLLFVNRRLRLVPDMLAPDFVGPWDVRNIKTIRDALWADDSLRRDYIAKNPADLAAEDLELVKSWQHRREGVFFVLRHLKKYSVFIKGSVVYGVLGLASPLSEVVPFVPCYLQTVLLPFEDRIIYDSLVAPYNITFGKGYRTSLEHTYNDAKEREAIVASLLPSAPASPVEERETARSSNAKVLDAFRTYLYRSGLSPKVVERDLTNMAAFADEYLLSQTSPQSLREFELGEVRRYLSQVQESELSETKRRETRTSLKRLIQFLRDTERMDYDAAVYALDVLKGRE